MDACVHAYIHCGNELVSNIHWGVECSRGSAHGVCNPHYHDEAEENGIRDKIM
jgi:hypothetical protein